MVRKRSPTRCEHCVQCKIKYKYNPRCAKCSGDNHTRDCHTSVRICEIHPADYRSCVYIKQLQKQRYLPLRARQPNQHRKNFNVSNINPGVWCIVWSEQNTVYIQDQNKNVLAQQPNNFDSILTLLTLLISKMNRLLSGTQMVYYHLVTKYKNV